ncbi:MAG: AAA family ATPase [Thermoanaerobaculia bacterium]
MASPVPIEARWPPATEAGLSPDAGVLDLILAGVRIRACRRGAWLRHLWGDGEPVTGAEAGFDDRDTPEAEAEWLAAAPEARTWNARLEQVEHALAGDAGAPWRRLAELFRLSRGELDLLRTCLAKAIDPDLGAVFAALQHHPGRGWPNEPLAARLFGHGRRTLWSPGSALAVWRLVTAGDAGPGEPAPLNCDPQVRDWLHSELGLDGELVGAVTEVELAVPPLPGWPVEETAELIRRAVEGGAGIRVRIVGPAGSGRRTFAAAVAKKFDIAALAVDVDALDEADWVELYIRVQRLAVLAGAALVWHGSALERRWPSHVAPAPIQFVACDPHQDVTPCPLLLEHQLDLPAPTLDERRHLWTVQVPESAAWPPHELENLAARHRLMVGDIVAAGRRRPASAAEAAVICRELTRHRLGDLGQLLDCPFRWEDLVIPDRLRQDLEDFVFEARDRAAFWETTSARRLFPRGTALVGLLGGPPGTGKTMAAQVVAADLELDLFRIDLATVVSKYIGETSKNLRQIFSRAAHMNAVMLFDEADALFSKRTEVKDSHDRYANTDTNYLLQMLEDYRGVALLATNKKGNVDAAFIRRIRYVFDFRRPDAPQRHTLWHRILGEIGDDDATHSSPTVQRLAAQIEILAQGVEMTGAQIKNAALAAAFSARQRRRKLAAADVLRGVERELGKDGRALPKRLRERLVRDG